MLQILLIWCFMHITYVLNVKPLIGFNKKPYSEKKRIVLSIRDVD